jgi:hypothetical protein
MNPKHEILENILQRKLGIFNGQDAALLDNQQNLFRSHEQALLIV